MSSDITISLSAFAKANGRIKTPSTIENMAVAPPIPKANISTPTAVNHGDRDKLRIASFTSEK
jgi:hypothetical protein